MSKPSTHLFKTGRSTSATSAFDLCAMIPVLAFAYSAVIQPLIYFNFPPSSGLEGLLESRIEDRVFWPVMAAISLVLAARHRVRIGRPLAPNIIALVAYLAFAGASVAWAFKPELSFIRFVKEIMVITAIVLPALMAARSAEILRGIFLCFVVGAVVNVLLIPGGYATLAQYGSTMVDIGYQGYFSGKNLLGEFAATAFLLSAHELLYPGQRRALGIVVAVIAVVLLFLSNSKTALGLALLAPLLAGLTLILGRTFRVSAAVILVSMLVGFEIFSKLTGFDTDRIAYMLTGDSSFTGRTTIWGFAETEIARSPFVGWGYQSFWLVGSDAPSILDAPGWVKLMPNAHNGYYDTMLELGYTGLAFLIIFLVTSLHVIGRVAERDNRRAWVLLSVALFVIIYNSLETLWLRAFDMSWVVFVIVVVEAARYWPPTLQKVPAHQSTDARSVSPRRLRSAWRPRLGARSQRRARASTTSWQ
jgi:exopolysaccharide production protein ExoQ